MTSRGIRNNNPGNIRIGDEWQGLKSPQEMSDRQLAERSFCVFKAPWWGIRAMARILITYKKRGANTMREIINRWAPPFENSTESYLTHVCSLTGHTPDEIIDVENYDTAYSIIAAIIRHENGSNPYVKEIFAGLILAGIEPRSEY